MNTLYKISKSVIPCALLTLCIGWTYAFSIFSPHLAEVFNSPMNAIQFAFCLNIFFLGIGAAFFGPLVEKNIKAASITSTILLFFGLCLSGIAIHIQSIVALYIGIGVLCGLAEGCGYVVPVKNLLLWFKKSNKKALISAVSIILFGLGSTLCTFIFNMMFGLVGIENMFFVLAGIYVIPMTIGSLMIKKPKYAELKVKKSCIKFSYIKYLKDKFFLKSWMFMFLNIAMGLILIGSCVPMLNEAGFSKEHIISIMMLCGIFNGAGRLIFPAIADFMKKRVYIWTSIIAIEILLMTMTAMSYQLIAFTVILANATYGAAFACLPSVLSDHYGDDELSFVHGFCLSAWGIASLLAYVILTFMLSMASCYYYVIFAILVFHIINFINTYALLRDNG